MTGRILKTQALVLPLVVSLMLAPTARAGVGDIISLLTTITDTIRSGIGVALNGIQAIQTTERKLQQEVLWPLTAINQTKASVTQVRSQFSSLAQQVHRLQANSATLVNPQQLESLLRSAQADNLEKIGRAFTAVYQPLPQANAASPAARNVMDMDDAFAAGSLKAAVICDQASEQMLDVADSLEQQTASAAPGSAPMLSAQGLTASLLSHAFLERMLAQELRQEAARLAHANLLVKESSAATRDLNKNMQQVLTKQ